MIGEIVCLVLGLLILCDSWRRIKHNEFMDETYKERLERCARDGVY